MAKYKPTEFMAEDSRYDKKAADYAASVCQKTPKLEAESGLKYFNYEKSSKNS